MKPCDTKRCCCSELTHSRKHRREPVKQKFANINIPETKSRNKMSQGSRRSERLANQVQILITQSLWAFSLIIQGEERQNACVHPQWPSEPWEEKGAGGRIQHTGNFSFINDNLISLHSIQNKRLRWIQSIWKGWEYQKIFHSITGLYNVLMSIS